MKINRFAAVVPAALMLALAVNSQTLTTGPTGCSPKKACGLPEERLDTAPH